MAFAQCRYRIASVLLLLPTVAGCSASRHGNHAATHGDDPDVRTLIALQHKLAAAMAPFDSVALDSILAPDVHSINAADKPLDKATMLHDLRAAQSVLLRVVDDSISVRRYGRTAIMTLRETITMKNGDAQQIGHLRMTEVWLKRSGRWQAVGGQALVIP